MSTTLYFQQTPLSSLKIWIDNGNMHGKVIFYGSVVCQAEDDQQFFGKADVPRDKVQGFKERLIDIAHEKLVKVFS